jgi:Catalase
MQWDFWTLNPQSAHQVTYLMGDRGIPKTWRHLNGYGSHTYLWVNEAGEKRWVKYHFISNQGVEGLTGAEANRTPVRTPTTIAAICTRQSNATGSRAGRCRPRPWRTAMPGTTASTRST